jgi:hypothetical protein
LTYVFEEKKWHENLFNFNIRKELFNEGIIGALKEIKFKSFSLMADTHSFGLKGSGSNVRLDQSKIDDFFKVIQAIKIQKEFKVADSKAFIAPEMDKYSLEFIFETARIILRIGTKSPIDGAFYLEVNDGKEIHWYLVEDVGPEPGVYSMNDTNRDAKYERLKTYFSLTEEFFYETRIFAQMGLAPEDFTKKIVKVDLKNTTNRSYIIYPQRKTTEPAPLSPLKFLDSRYQEFLTKIGQLQLSQIYKVFDRKLLKDEVSRWNIMVDTGTNYELILYHKYGSLTGNFLFSESLPYMVEILSNSATLFFTPWQYFWDRQIVALPDFKDWGMRDELIGFKLVKGSSIALKIPAAKDFFIEGPRQTPPRQEEFKKLFTYFVREADRVTSTDSSLREQVKSSVLFTLKIRGIEVIVGNVSGELIFYVPKYELYFHFFEGENLSIGHEFLDFFGN